MTSGQEYIWYASYGSNLSEERFLCYIKGGQPIGASRDYPGSRDKTLPIKKEKIYINHELYFAKKSRTWENSGVCFLKTTSDPKKKTLGRMYLVTKVQFIDIVQQETNSVSSLTINFNKAIKVGSLIFKENSYYGNLIYLGSQNNSPIFTFTNQENIENTNKPCENYLKTIVKGIKETYALTTPEIVRYFISISGISDNYKTDELTKIIDSVK